jgi:hypothetical protein
MIFAQLLGLEKREVDKAIELFGDKPAAEVERQVYKVLVVAAVRQFFVSEERFVGLDELRCFHPIGNDGPDLGMTKALERAQQATVAASSLHQGEKLTRQRINTDASLKFLRTDGNGPLFEVLDCQGMGGMNKCVLEGNGRLFASRWGGLVGKRIKIPAKVYRAERGVILDAMQKVRSALDCDTMDKLSVDSGHIVLNDVGRTCRNIQRALTIITMHSALHLANCWATFINGHPTKSLRVELYDDRDRARLIPKFVKVLSVGEKDRLGASGDMTGLYTGRCRAKVSIHGERSQWHHVRDGDIVRVTGRTVVRTLDIPPLRW